MMIKKIPTVSRGVRPALIAAVASIIAVGAAATALAAGWLQR